MWDFLKERTKILRDFSWSPGLMYYLLRVKIFVMCFYEMYTFKHSGFKKIIFKRSLFLSLIMNISILPFDGL